MSESLIVTSPDGRIQTVNAATCRILGYDEIELIGQPMEMLFADEYADVTLRQELEEGDSDSVTNLERTFLTKDGNKIPISFSHSVIRKNSKQSNGIVCIATDISQHKQIETELKKARDAALESARLKSEFLANMSHEIRTPMNGVIGMTELALDTELSKHQREYLNIVKSSAMSLMTVINDILDFSKIDAGKLNLDFINFNLRDTVDEAVRALALQAHEKGLELACHIPPNIPESLVGDPLRLRQVVINLVNNAVKFTDNGEVVVSVSLQELTDSEVAMHFAVTDTGSGIPQEKQEQIFAAFEQVDGSTTRKHGGTGLGLAISSQLVEMMGGSIKVESIINKGSTFHFTARFGLGVATSKKHPSALSDIRGMRVLVVDDNSTNRFILKEMLSSWNMRPTMVDGGHAALFAIHRAKEMGTPFPLILLDACMPEMDGFAVAEQIQQMSGLDGPTIMMLTSNDQLVGSERIRELGMSACLIKPVTQSNLLNTILTSLGHKLDSEVERISSIEKLVSANPLHLHFLVADDNAVNQLLAVRLLEKMGYTSTVAGNGKEAVAALEKEHFDVVLMDVQMPEMNGLEATKIIRQREQSSGTHIPIIALTAMAMKGDMERCTEAGMDGYVSKPIQTKELVTAIEKVMPIASLEATLPVNITVPTEQIDEKDLLERFGGDIELMQDIIRLFLVDCPRLIGNINNAVKDNNLTAFEESVHALKGVVMNFPDRSTTNAILKLEMIGRQGELSIVPDALASLEEALCNLQMTLSSFTLEYV